MFLTDASSELVVASDAALLITMLLLLLMLAPTPTQLVRTCLIQQAEMYSRPRAWRWRLIRQWRDAPSCTKWPKLWTASHEEDPWPATEDPRPGRGWQASSARRRAADGVGMRHRGWLWFERRPRSKRARGVDRLAAITNTLSICHLPHPTPASWPFCRFSRPGNLYLVCGGGREVDTGQDSH